MATAERAQMIGKAKGLNRICMGREIRVREDLKRIDLAKAYSALGAEAYHLAENNRLKNTTFVTRLESMIKRYEELESEAKPLLDQYDTAEMMSYVDEGTKIKESAPSPSPALLVKEPESNGQLTLQLSRGGKRAGAGRKSIGRTQKVSVSLPDREWTFIDGLVDDGHVKSRSEYFRLLHMSQRYPCEFITPLYLPDDSN